MDIRDGTELQEMGHAVGSEHCPRGLLEFKADPTSASHDAQLQPDWPVLLHCAAGGRAALAKKLVLDRGYTQVDNLLY